MQTHTVFFIYNHFKYIIFVIDLKNSCMFVSSTYNKGAIRNFFKVIISESSPR